MGLDIEVMTSLIGISGLALAAILSSIGYLYRGWSETKKSARKVLYILLEVRHALNASIFDSKKATEDYLNHYMSRLKEKGFNIDEEEINLKISNIVREYFLNLSHSAKTDIEDRLLIPFENSLSDLSQSSPVLAYRLRGKEKLETLAKLNSSYLENIKVSFIDELKEDWIKKVMLEFSSDMEKEAINKIVNHLDEEIILLSRHCGWFESYRCKNVISVKYGKFDEEIFTELDSLIDRLIEKIESAANIDIELVPEKTN